MNNILRLVILAPLVFLFALALDIYAPAIPLIKDYMHTSEAVIQLSVSSFVFVMGLGQILLGPFSDYFGRKPIAILGILVFIFGAMVSAYSSSPFLLILGRVLQALGCASTLIAAYASVRDVYRSESQHIYSLLNSTISIVPLVAPVVGGKLAATYGWQADFLFLAGFGVFILLITMFFFKETLSKNNEFTLKKIFRGNWSIVKHPVFIGYTIFAMCGYSCFLAFFSVTPYILITLLNVSVESFGYYFATIGIIVFFGGILSSRLILNYGLKTVSIVGFLILLISGFAMISCYFIYGLTIIGYLSPSLLMAIGASFLINTGIGGAITPFKNAGFAASLSGCLQFVMGAIFITVLMIWPVKSAIPISLLIIAMGLISVLDFFFVIRIKCRKC